MSKLIKTFYLVLFVGTFMAACGLGTNPPSTPPASNSGNSFAPRPGDDSLVRGAVEIDKTEIALLMSYPVQVQLKISYFTSTPCHQFRLVVHQPDENRQIHIDAYSLMKPNQVCNLMRLSTPSVASLNLGSFPAGHYTVWINGNLAAEFDA
jgi:hypothetical protein